MSWLYLVIAGCFEIFGVGSIKLFTTKKDLRSLLILIQIGRASCRERV